MPDTTLLAISGIDIPPYSARGITQSFSLIGGAFSAVRDINGTLVNLSQEQFRKFQTQISCRDQQHPALDGVWPGETVVVDCVTEFSYLTSGGSPSRTVVPDSSRTEGDFTFYRPRLTMMVVDYSIDTDEYNSEIGWTLSLIEV